MNLSQLRQLKPKLPLLSNNNNNLNQKELVIWLDLRRPTEVVRENLLKCKGIFNKCKKLSLPGMLLPSSLQLIPLLSRTVEVEVIVAIANLKIKIHLLKIQANTLIKIKITTQVVEGIEVEEEEEAMDQEEAKQQPHQVNLKVGTDFVSGAGILLPLMMQTILLKNALTIRKLERNGGNINNKILLPSLLILYLKTQPLRETNKESI